MTFGVKVPGLYDDCQTCKGRIYAQRDLFQESYRVGDGEGVWLHSIMEDWTDDPHNGVPSDEVAAELEEALRQQRDHVRSG
jgi:hypothetical protein